MYGNSKLIPNLRTISYINKNFNFEQFQQNISQIDELIDLNDNVKNLYIEFYVKEKSNGLLMISLLSPLLKKIQLRKNINTIVTIFCDKK